MFVMVPSSSMYTIGSFCPPREEAQIVMFLMPMA